MYLISLFKEAKTEMRESEKELHFLLLPSNHVKMRGPRPSLLLLAASAAAAFSPPPIQRYFASSGGAPGMACVRRGILSAQMMAKGRSGSRSGSAGEQRRRGMAERILRVAMEEMHEGMELEGIVRSVKEYGAFIDVGE